MYKQLEGLALDNPTAPCIANIFLCHLEEIIFRDCTPNFCKIYLGDTFACFNEENQANAFLDYINNLHPNINYTLEVQRNNFLSFLDFLSFFCFLFCRFVVGTSTGINLKEFYYRKYTSIIAY